MEYKKVIIIGYGSIVINIIKSLYEKKNVYEYELQYLEYEVYSFNQAKKFALENNIKFVNLIKPLEVEEYFLQEAKQTNTLIISASNNYIFTSKLTNNKRIRIINFHNALLPLYPGRNAPSWMIYNGEKMAGITWHYVNSGIDEGDIITQATCDIPNDIKAYELAAQLMRLGYEAFEESIDDIILDIVKTKKQKIENDRKIYKSFEIPGNGFFELDDPPEYIYRLLRSVDYGKNRLFPEMKTCIGGEDVTIKRYKIVNTIDEKENSLFLPMNDTFLELLYTK